MFFGTLNYYIELNEIQFCLPTIAGHDGLKKWEKKSFHYLRYNQMQYNDFLVFYILLFPNLKSLYTTLLSGIEIEKFEQNIHINLRFIREKESVATGNNFF